MSGRIETAAALNEFVKGYLPDWMGVRLLTLGAGRLESEMAVTRSHLAPNGFLHAASVVALADTSCGCACMGNLPEGAESFTTIELKCNYMGTVREGTVHCTATARHLGRMTQVWDASVTSPDGRELALFRCTQMVLWPK